MEELTLWVIQHVTKMPKAHKFTLGERWLETCLDVTALLVDASFTRDKHPLLAKAACGLTRARLLARLHHRLRLLGESQLTYFGEQSTEISKMVGGWARSLRQRREATA